MNKVQSTSMGEDDIKSWCTGGDLTMNQRGQTEIDVIREWFVNIFTPFEKTADLVVMDFKFEQMSHLRNSLPAGSSTGIPLSNTSSKPVNGKHNGNDSLSDALKSDKDEYDFDEEEMNDSNNICEKHFTVLKRATVNLLVQGKPKTYSVVIKVLPTDDSERYTTRSKFEQLLKFSKEVQVYLRVVQCMVVYDEKRYPSACVEPPVPRCYLGQLDAQNDVTLIQRDSEQCVTGMFPFAVDATSFREIFRTRTRIVKRELTRYLVSKVPRGYASVVKASREDIKEMGDKIERHLRELFLATPHGAVDLRNIMFQYDEVSGRPICAKFLDFSTLTVSSPVIDITYFLHSSVAPELASHHHATLLQVYHRAHLEAIKSFGMHGYEMELEDLINEYQAKQDYGSMMACLLKPALYVLQSLNHAPSAPNRQSCDSKQQDLMSSHRRRRRRRSTSEDEMDPSTVEEVPPLPHSNSEEDSFTGSLKIDKNLVPVDLRLHGYLSALAKACPCPCSVGNRELTIAELSADSLEDLHMVAREQQVPGVKTLDCGGSKSTFKKFILGLLHPSKKPRGF
ncbi:unnamed protein product [Lepeophtheirus salmonis]|uniref:(salmon louse) hypothetical protein n=1 Tax=Lepeophtheirus salmonis TaxID=72036 RepID=A0A7R8H9U7_LEPSM|nr:unnamed protein product [Lepeophtheirus salmonis]CAF2966747.1 unnamed protein product [Lepeophtheirus salmonis]